jgi:hypothetical protein
VTDWFDDPEQAQTAAESRESWMRLYIIAGLIGIGALGVICGMLHILPA